MANWDKELNYRRILIIFGIFFLVFGGFLVRLTIIQVFGHMKYSRLAATQRQGPLLTNILRGGFYDRNGKMLRGTVRSWYLLIEKASAARSGQIIAGLKPFMAGNFAAEYSKNKERAFWIFPKPLNNHQIDRISALDYPECKIVANVLRQDHYQGIAWHLLGIADQERGLSGLEYLYQPLLYNEATSGALFTLNDGKQRFFPGLGLRTQSKPNPVGVVLTIDRRIQQIAERVMDHRAISGAVVVLDAGSGEILAMASRPRLNSFDEKSFSRVDHPFVNRAVSAYHPGSIFKLVILSAGLDSDQLKPDEYFEDRGFYQIGDKKWLCTTSRNGHGVISVKDALAYSCNPVFIEITMRLKPQFILEYADKFGLGQPCNIGLRTESWGELPAGIGLSEGEIANLALGQQDIYATPLQIASLVQTIANDGVRCIPQLVLGTRQSGAAITPLAKSPSVRVLKIETANTMKDMMAAVVSYGTGAGVRLGSDVAGKTGTAQVNDAQGTPSHAWFAGFFPLTQPKYVTVVFCEQGLSGAETAAPVFKELMEKVTRIED